MRSLMAVCILGIAVPACAFASAASDAAFELYRTGKYDAAIAAGEAAKDGESLAIAARAAFAEANLSETPCLSCLQRVEVLARRSIALDAAHPEAFIYLAASLGYQARIVGSLRAQFGHFPEQAKAAIDSALMVAPGDDWALAAAGAWHIEIVRNGGAVLGRDLYGATIEEGKAYFRRAFAAEPKNLVIRFQYALSLSGYDFGANRDDATAALSEATTIEPRTAYEGVIRQRAVRLLELVKANKRSDYLALVNKYQGYQ